MNALLRSFLITMANAAIDWLVSVDNANVVSDWLNLKANELQRVSADRSVAEQTLEDTLRVYMDLGAHEIRGVIRTHEDGTVLMYLHPMNVDGPSVDYEVVENYVVCDEVTL